MSSKQNYSIIMILMMLIFLINCAPKEDDNLKVSDEIASANEIFMTTFNRGDAVGLAALYTDNGQVLPPNSEFVTGKEAIQSFWQAMMDMGIKEVALETIEVEGHGNTAIEISRCTLKGEGGQILDNGKYIVVWKKENNQWKLHRDIFNSNTPMQKVTEEE